MTKKTDFLPALKTADKPNPKSVHAIGVPYMDDRDKIKLCQPTRCYEKNGPQWKLQPTEGTLFTKSVRQEEDVYDPNLVLYYKTLERGLKKPEPLKFNMRSLSTSGAQGRNKLIEAIRATAGTYSTSNKHKWTPNAFFPTLLQNEKPLNEPVENLKAITTLDRNFDHYPWFYNRNALDSLSGSTVEHDKLKSKVLKKKLRQMRRSTMKRDPSPSM